MREFFSATWDYFSNRPPQDFAIIALLVLLCVYLCVCMNRNKANHVRMEKELYEQTTSQIIETVARTIDAKDPYTNGHSKRVAHFSVLIGKKLRFSKEDLVYLRYAALLHDIGKIGIPDAVLQKPAGLTDSEYALMKQHPQIGAEILEGVPALKGVTVGARYHHEKWDGTGYNEGLSGVKIPLLARIIGVADTYDTMISDRPYHKGETPGAAIAEFKRCAGTQFDPTLAAIMIDIIEEEAKKKK